MMNDNQYTFHFFSSNFETDLDNRTKTKSLIAKLMAALKKNNDNEFSLNFEEKNKLLSSDPKLYELYKELVVNGLISPEEFWSSPSVLENCHGQTIKTSIKLKSTKLGIPSGFWSLLAPVSKGCNEICLNLTSECINAIFLAYPAVKTKFDEMVPREISEMDFWTRFFQAQYFYRDRSKSVKETNNMFLQIFIEADSNFKNEIISGYDNIDFNLQNPATAPEGYGGILDMDLSNNPDFFPSRRFNLQSRTLLKTFQDSSLSIKTLKTNPFKSAMGTFAENGLDATSIDLDSEKFSGLACAVESLTAVSKFDNYDKIMLELEQWKHVNYNNSHLYTHPPIELKIQDTLIRKNLNK
ncbi:hypothetical protein HZS_7290 [Henneguya salminicola]|nr:hypothetical protein HZS_7290 [Henneguya salminicola]